MFQATKMLFLYAETPLHAGTGRGLGTVDLPIQRERTTGYPMVYATGVKGSLRATARKMVSPTTLTEAELFAVFGPETAGADAYAGALSTGDARILLFPVRSLNGVFAWTTSPDVLARFRRTATALRVPVNWNVPTLSASDQALVSGNDLIAGTSVVLEDFSFTPDQAQAAAVAEIAEWLKTYAMPQGAEYQYWRDALAQRLCILPNEAFRDFVLYATEIQPHIKLKQKTKTVEDGMLWTTESLPPDTLLYSPMMATQSRADGVDLDADAILQKVAGLDVRRIQLGGDETTGQGIVALQFADSAAGGLT